jgi:cytochrome P450
MDTTQPVAAATAPAHVPADLVREFDFPALGGPGRDPIQVATEFAREGPPVFYAASPDRGNAGGASHDGWVVSRHDLIREVYQDAETFSSRKNANFAALLGEDWDLLPLEKDPPEHGVWRTLMNPLFSPTRVGVVEETIQATTRRLVDDALAKGECEFVKDFAEVFPVHIFLGMFGLPLADAPRFVAWSNGLIHSDRIEDAQAAARAIRDYLVDMIGKRRAQPTGDVISYLVTSEVEGRPVSDGEALAMCFLLYAAGLDTVASMLAFIFKHLAEHPDHQQRLRDDPSLIPQAIEEFLRAYPIVVSHRRVTRDTEFHGVQMKAGDWVHLPTMLAGRDETEFPDPDRVDFDRERVTHISFAAGVHRCLGSHLARRELRSALSEWLSRAPPFRIKPGETPVTQSISVFGVHYLPLVWDAA